MIPNREHNENRWKNFKNAIRKDELLVTWILMVDQLFPIHSALGQNITYSLIAATVPHMAQAGSGNSLYKHSVPKQHPSHQTLVIGIVPETSDTNTTMTHILTPEAFIVVSSCILYHAIDMLLCWFWSV